MTAWEIKGCTVADAAALARNNMAAFWEDSTWILVWPKDISLDFLIAQSTKRQARNLLRSREDTRHQKATDPATGALVGYARWILPPSHVAAVDGEPMWAEVQVPDVDEEKRKHYERLAASAWWNLREEMDEIDAKNTLVKKRILAEKPYINLEYLAVHPENKSKGIASALVESGIQYAEKIGLPIFVLAFKAGRGVYARLGFKEVDCVIQDDTKYGGQGEYGVYFMVYDVSPKPDES